MSIHKLLITYSALFWGVGAISQVSNLSAPVQLESTATLPSGVRNPRFLNAITTIDTKFATDGALEPLGARLNKRVSWQDVVDGQADETQKNLVRSILNDLGYKLTDSPGNTSGVVKIFANAKVPILGFGVTENLTLAVVVPVVSIDVAVDSGFLRDANGQEFINQLCKTSPDECNKAAAKLNDATQQKLARLGYEPLRSYSVAGLGDIQIVSKYRWFGTTESALATKLSLVLPTGSAPNANRVIDLPTGDSRFKVGLGVTYDRQVLGLRWNVYGNYIALLPSRHMRRLPTSGDDSLSADSEMLTRRLGEQVSVGTGLELPLPKAGLVLSTAVGSQYLSKTRYTGSATEGLLRSRYTALEDLEPAQVLHAVTASVGFSTVDWYKKKEFFLPLQLVATYSHPIGGRNAPRNDMVAGEMVLFF